MIDLENQNRLIRALKTLQPHGALHIYALLSKISLPSIICKRIFALWLI